MHLQFVYCAACRELRASVFMYPVAEWTSVVTQYRRNTPELLAPAGGPEALRAAVNNGADAVYLGTSTLNARRGADNFAIEDLAASVKFAHLKGTKVYLAANVVVLSNEMGDALELADAAWAAGVDALIVQDLGYLQVLRSELPDIRVHASTQLNAHNSLTVRELARMGVERVTLARETSLDEIAKLVAESPVEIESFIHGALCMSYSGQCLMSSLIGRRSANRGLCAQPCRMTYELLDEKGRAADTPGNHLLSPKDLSAIDALGEFVKSGVASLKIEGRMKDPEYVALVTSVYRHALDRAVEDPDAYEPTDSDRAILSEAFSRGFSSAYLDEIRDNRMMSYQRPNNRGVPIGRVARTIDRTIDIALDKALDADDTIEVWTSRGRFAQRVGEIRLNGRTTRTAPAGATVTIHAEKPAATGDRVFRVVNASLVEAAHRTFADERGLTPLGVDVSVRLLQGEPLEIRVTHGTSSGVGRGPSVEAARTKSVTADEVVEHVGRFGGTLFEPSSWDIELQPGVGIGFSQLHGVRREAVEDLERALLAPWAGRTKSEPSVPTPAIRPRRERPVAPEIVVWTEDLVTARSCLAAGAHRAIMPHWSLLASPDEDVPADVIPETPRIAHDREVADLVALAGSTSRMVVGNLGLLPAAQRDGLMLEAHWSLNAVNPWTVEALGRAGASFVWLSPELSGSQATRIAESSRLPVGLSIYGRQEVMVTEHCVLMSIGECTQVCGTCPRRRSWHALRDQKGYAFPVSTDPMGRSHIYNSVPLDLTRAASEIVAAGIAAVRLDFTIEHSQEAQKITRIVREALQAAVAGRSYDEVAADPATAGHFFRGVI